MQKQESGESDLENRTPRFSVTNFVSGKHRRALISLSLMVACILTSASAQGSNGGKPEQAPTSPATTKVINIWPGVALGPNSGNSRRPCLVPATRSEL
jgi:hypothetical protein